MEWLDISMFGFLVVFLATMFFIGELVVKAKGIFGIIGFSLITLYFAHQIGDTSGLWVIILYVAGLLLILTDGKLLGDGLLSFFGVLLMIVGIAVPAPNLIYAVMVGSAVIFGGFAALLFMKVFPRRDLWSKMTLTESMTSEEGYNSMNESYGELLGKEGKTLTDFRPIGTVEIEGKTYSATTGAVWLEKDTDIKVTSVDGTRIVVTPR
ncbi:membrane-bound ClpP family serine protease [Geomicrobium halophilum]|uniref:Membrane-bound ClpP family serine protease n=1 Tax=Geomicrobium halophilum TaxID=549000 RepID=A0A841PMC5_9BACL|nr:NfeD family protein [Geomicrobium halophilum]MBB6448864.1 membrane-bound ClpP family serine protease [Geomicrobium halophilum]